MWSGGVVDIKRWLENDGGFIYILIEQLWKVWKWNGSKFLECFLEYAQHQHLFRRSIPYGVWDLYQRFPFHFQCTCFLLWELSAGLFTELKFARNRLQLWTLSLLYLPYPSSFINVCMDDLIGVQYIEPLQSESYKKNLSFPSILFYPSSQDCFTQNVRNGRNRKV